MSLSAIFDFTALALLAGRDPSTQQANYKLNAKGWLVYVTASTLDHIQDLIESPHETDRHLGNELDEHLWAAWHIDPVPASVAAGLVDEISSEALELATEIKDTFEDRQFAPRACLCLAEAMLDRVPWLVTWDSNLTRISGQALETFAARRGLANIQILTPHKVSKILDGD